ncbi:MAG: sulfotransferase domain-containing protein [Reyranellaceae bacterium]
MQSARLDRLDSLRLRAAVRLRKLLVKGAGLLPDETRRRLERRLRGREEALQIAGSRAFVVSCAKSGRTWLHVMLDAYEEASGRDLGVFFTHDNYIRDVTGGDGRPWHAGKRTVVLARHPADIAVSMFHHWRHRMTPRKRWINRYPDPARDIAMFDFVLREAAGMKHAIALLNRWADEIRDRDDALMVRYEDMRADPRRELARIVRFLDGAADEAAIASAVEYGSFENMQRREREAAVAPDAPRQLRPGDVSNPQSFKARSGEAGGWRRQFDADQVSQIDALVAANLDPYYGYAPSAAPAAGAAGR